MIDLDMLRVWLYGGGCVAIALAMFCRAVKMDRRTASLPIRISVTCGGGAAVWCMWGLIDGHTPGWPDVLLVAAWLVMLVTTSRLWEYGLPHDFRRPLQFDEARPW